MPVFQRGFIWARKDRLALFESIAAGYPIGSLIFWRAEHDYPSSPTIGPFQIPQEQSPYPKDYIIDGHQRIATLFGVLHAASEQASKSTASSKPFAIEDFEQWIIYYELENEKFTYTEGEEDTTYYLPLHALIETWDFLHEREKILKKFGGHADVYLEKAAQLAQTFLNYDIPIIRISGGDMDNGLEVFSRINSCGRMLTKEQIFHASSMQQRGVIA